MDFEWLWEGFLAGALWSVGGQSERSSQESSRQHLHLHVAFQGLHLLNLCFDPLCPIHIVTNSNTLVAKVQLKHHLMVYRRRRCLLLQRSRGRRRCLHFADGVATDRWFFLQSAPDTGAKEQNHSHYIPI